MRVGGTRRGKGRGGEGEREGGGGRGEGGRELERERDAQRPRLVRRPRGPTAARSLVDQTAPFPSTGCITSPARGREGLVHETKRHAAGNAQTFIPGVYTISYHERSYISKLTCRLLACN